jgi:pimeloyl-ACP methyl ester carboxylesterase
VPRRTGRALIALAGLIAASAAAAPAADAAARPCPTGARCGVVRVPLDHAGRIPGTLPLAYATLPARTRPAGTLVVLSGGPGQAAIPLTRPFGRILAPLRRSYDIVFVDQRGTGRSGAVSCRLTRAADVAACAKRLGARRAVFTTGEGARDLEDLRLALRVPKLTLLGVSYGGKLAGEYARRFPASTAAVVLDSPAPVDGLDAVSRLPELAAPRVLREVCASRLCRVTVGDAASALGTAARRLQRRPLRGPVVGPSGRVRTRTLTEAGLYGLLRLSDEDPALRGELPAAIASAARGDAAPLLHLVPRGSGSGADAGINAARLLATSCVEGRLPWAPDAPLAGRARALRAYVAQVGPAFFAPFRPATVLAASETALCASWPATPRPEWVPPTPGPDVPVLVLGGREDLRTPLEDARRTAGQYPHALVLPIPGVGHSTLGTDPSGCAVAGTVAFLHGRPVRPCARRPAGFVAAPYVPATLAALRPTCGAGGRVGRTCSAVALTLLGMATDLLRVATSGPASLASGEIRFGGLRGGFVSVTRAGVELHALQWIRGVTVSGTFRQDGTGRLVIGGRAAAAGVFELRGKARPRAVLGGRRVRLTGNPFVPLTAARTATVG